MGATPVPTSPLWAGTERDRYLDATLQTFLRHGVRRTRMVDIADEAGVSRTTAYRVLGSVDRAALSLLQRELGAFLHDVTAALHEAASLASVLRVCARAMAEVEAHPLFRKLRQDEPVIIGEAIARQTGLIIDTVTSALVPSFTDLARRGILTDDDPARLVEVLVRLGVMCTLHPPAGGFERVLGCVLRAGDPVRARAPEGGRSLG